ncbi:MAG: hypothetical protein M3Z35_16905 [Nitrospirota bacterium]|nr:hypothetical protein [Nitrospirota bacterium]
MTSVLAERAHPMCSLGEGRAWGGRVKIDRAGEASPNPSLYWWSEGAEESFKRCNYE